MDPVTGAAVIGAASQAGNIVSGYINNKQNQKYQDKVYDKERQHSLEDWERQNRYNEDMWNRNNQYNEDMWNRQNAYNHERWRMQNDYDSPAAQMARWKAAGINPNAMFGHMSGGQAIDASRLAPASTQQNAGRNPTKTGAHSNKAGDFSGLAAIMPQMLNMQMQKAQIDNIRKQGELYDAEKIAKLLNVTGLEIGNEVAGINRDILKNTWHSSVQKAEIEVASALQNYQYNQREQDRKQEAHTMSMQSLAEQIRSAREQQKLTISNREAIELEKTLKRYEIQLNNLGLQKNDGLITRMLGNLYNKEIFKDGTSLKDRIHYLWNQD